MAIDTSRAWLVFGGFIPTEAVERIMHLLMHESRDYGPFYGFAASMDEAPIIAVEDDAETPLALGEWWWSRFHFAAENEKPICIGLVPHEETDNAEDAINASGAFNCMIDLFREYGIPYLVVQPWHYYFENSELVDGQIIRGFPNDPNAAEIELSPNGAPIITITEGDWFAPSLLARRARKALSCMDDFTTAVKFPPHYWPENLSDEIEEDEMQEAA